MKYLFNFSLLFYYFLEISDISKKEGPEFSSYLFFIILPCLMGSLINYLLPFQWFEFQNFISLKLVVTLEY